MEEYSTCAPSAQKPNMAEREMHAGVFAEAGMPSTGFWCISEEYKSSKMKKKGSIGFIWSLSCPTCPTGVFLKIVLCSYFAG